MKKTITKKPFRSFQSAMAGLALAFATTATAQVSNYTFAQSTGTYTAMVGGTVVANAAMVNMDDDVFGPITMPAFVFDGVVYTSVYINTNGHITFGSASSTTNYLAISGTETYAGAVCAFSEDLDAAASGTRNIKYLLTGSDFVIQWQNVGRFAVANDRISFQIHLNSANNQISIVYGGTITPDNDTFYPEIGLRGPNNTFPANVNNRRVVAATGAWTNSTAGTANTSSCYFNSATPGTVPAVGTTFTWTPPAIDMSAVSLAAPGNSGCYTANETVSVLVRNCGGSTINFATTPVTVNCNVTGPNPQTFTAVVVNTGTLAVNATRTVVVSTTYNMTTNGTYTFNASTSTAGDPMIANNTMTPSVKTSHDPSVVVSGNATVCAGTSTNLTSTGTAYPYVSTFTNNTPIAIPDATPAGVNSTLVVSGSPVLASTVSLQINSLSHTFDGDLIFTITAPNGSSVIICNQEGGGGANFTNTLFSTSAVTPIASGTAPFTGSFLPDNPFSGLTGNANGTWTLNVSDNAAIDVGTLQSWSLFFTNTNSISTYSWNPAGSLSSSTISNPVATPPSTTTYSVVVTDASGCSNTGTTTITVNPLPAVTANSTAVAVCSGNSVTLTGGGATSYSWTGGVTNGVSFVPASTLTYTVTGTDANGCVNTANTTVTVNPTPTVSATATSSTICAGNSSSLTGAGASTYTWMPGSLSGTTVSVSPAATTTYTVTGSSAAGCSSTANVTVTVNPLPTVTASSTAAAVCAGNNVTLTGGGATSYSWTGGVTNAVSFVPASTLTYTVTGTDANGCTNTANTTVTVNALPTVTANSTAAAVCTGSNVTLTGGGATSYSWTGGVTDGISFVPASTLTYTVTGTDANGCTNTANTTVTVNTLPTVTANSTAAAVCTGSNVTLTGGGATSYSWTGGVSDGVSFVPASTLTYTVTGTDANGCMNTANTTVTVNALPTVTANSTAAAVCTGSNVTLTGGGATSYSWTGGVTDGVSFIPVSTLTYTVTGTDVNGCMNTANTTVTVNALPTVVANATANAVCEGSSVTLSGSGATSYSWTGGVTDAVSFIPVSTLTYTVTGTDANGCMNTDMTTVTVNTVPTVNLGPDVTQCGGSVALDAQNAGATYLWSEGSTTQMINPSSSGIYFVDVTNGSGCANRDSVMITINTLPVVSVSFPMDTVCIGGGLFTLTGESPSGGTWSGTGVSGNTMDPMTAGLGTDAITYTYTDVNGCSGSDVQNLWVDVCNGVAPLTTSATNISVYPNPNSGVFMLEVNGITGNMLVEITDMQGRIVYTSQENDVQPGFAKQISLDDLANGIYLLRLTSSSEQHTERISLQK